MSHAKTPWYILNYDNRYMSFAHLDDVRRMVPIFRGRMNLELEVPTVGHPVRVRLASSKAEILEYLDEDDVVSC